MRTQVRRSRHEFRRTMYFLYPLENPANDGSLPIAAQSAPIRRTLKPSAVKIDHCIHGDEPLIRTCQAHNMPPAENNTKSRGNTSNATPQIVFPAKPIPI